MLSLPGPMYSYSSVRRRSVDSLKTLSDFVERMLEVTKSRALFKREYPSQLLTSLVFRVQQHSAVNFLRIVSPRDEHAPAETPTHEWSRFSFSE